jgi:hypothetical protein
MYLETQRERGAAREHVCVAPLLLAAAAHESCGLDNEQRGNHAGTDDAGQRASLR